jgi:hypothetical protein
MLTGNEVLYKWTDMSIQDFLKMQIFSVDLWK